MKICSCNGITDGAARAHAQTLTPDSTKTRSAAKIFRACCGTGHGCCMGNFEKLVDELIAEGWKPAGQSADLLPG